MDIVYERWEWYIAGPCITLVMLLLYYFGNSFGLSSNLRTMCSIAGGSRVSDFFNFNWKAQKWNLVFLLGLIIGGYLAHNFLTPNSSLELSNSTVESLNNIGFKEVGSNYLPKQLFSLEALSNWKVVLFLLFGGFFIGFGSRYAGGCTSGHAISGLSNLQLPSLIAVIGFFIGGITATYFILPKLLLYIL